MRQEPDYAWLSGMVMLILFLSVWMTSCASLPQRPYLDQYRTVKLAQGQPAPNSGWLISESVLIGLVERAEACKP